MSEPPGKLEHILLQAISLYHAGRTRETGELCRNILESADEPNMLHLLGAVHLMNADSASAAEYLTSAARVDSGNADILNNLATALRKSGDAEQAEQFYQRAIALDGDSAKSLVNLVNLYRGAGNLKQAADHYREALEKDPDHYRALNNPGLTLEALNEPVSALNMFQRAMEAKPGNSEPLVNVALLLGKLGEWRASLETFDKLAQSNPKDGRYQTGRAIALAKLDRMTEAETAFDNALVLSPGSVETLQARAAALCDHERSEEALEFLESAIKIAPDSADLHALSGFALIRMGRFEKALISLDRALLHDPRNANGWAHRGDALHRLGRHEIAIEAYDEALTHNPLHLDARLGRALSRLKRSRFTGGWRDYLARPAMRDAPPEFSRTPLPDDLTGKQLKISGEKNISDDLFFMRFAPMLTARGATIGYIGNSGQRRLMERIGLFSETVDTDLIVSAGDLPYLIGAEAAAGTVRAISIPALPNRLEEAAAMLRAAGPGPYIGVTWRSRGDHPTPDAIAAALASIKGDVILLQAGASEDEIGRFEYALGRAAANLTPQDGDMETALALMELLDEYVSVDNINIHLRAARGRACRGLIANQCDFYWMESGSRSPWFPESPLYRRAPDGTWKTALNWLARDLETAHGALQTQAS